MNYNVLVYAIYLALMVFIIGYVGRLFYNNGRIFILSLFHGNEDQTDYMNRILLVAYYLFNIGYAFVRLRFWERLNSFGMLVSSLAETVGLLILILAVTHYFNMLLIYYLSKKKNLLSHK